MDKNPRVDVLEANSIEEAGIQKKHPRRLLVALKREDSDQFFPDGIDLSELPVDACIARNRDMEGEAWASLIHEFRPEIILSGWATPALSTSICAQRDFCTQYICHIGGTVRNLLPLELIERGVLVSNWGNTVARTVAEHALLLVLACARNLVHWKLALNIPTREQHLRTSVLNTATLHGKRVGIHGVGNIARELAALLAPFGVQLTFYSENVSAGRLKESGMAAAQSLDELFATSDVLIECEALTPNTRGTVTAKRLKSLPLGAIFVNVGRGALLEDEEALAQLAQSGHLRVATDVAINEPVAQKDPLRQTPSILLSPHIAGPTKDTYTQCGQFALNNIRRYVAGHLPQALVTKDIYMRST